MVYQPTPSDPAIPPPFGITAANPHEPITEALRLHADRLAPGAKADDQTSFIVSYHRDGRTRWWDAAEYVRTFDVFARAATAEEGELMRQILRDDAAFKPLNPVLMDRLTVSFAAHRPWATSPKGAA